MSPVLPGKRGFQVPGGGAWGYMQDPTWHRGPSSDLAGFTPWVLSGSTYKHGIPLGPIQYGSGILQCDPITWFEYKRISSPSLFSLGLNGLGKSSLNCRYIACYAGYGIPSLVLADLKGEYVNLIRGIGGQVLPLGRGQGRLNILDLTEVYEAAKELPTVQADQLLATARARRKAAVESLFSIEWGHSPTFHECSILDVAMSVMDATIKGEGVMPDLLQVIRSAPPAVQEVALNRGDMGIYQQTTKNLEATLVDWCRGGGLGEIFAGKTTARLIRGQSAVFDVSAISEDDARLRAAIMVASWSAGFGQIAVSHAYAAAGLEKYQPVVILQDELQQALQLPGVAQRYDSLTRLDRHKGVGRIMTSHSINDPNTLADPRDRAMANGFLARSGIVMLFGQDGADMDMLTKTLALNEREQDYLVGLSTPPGDDEDVKHLPGAGYALCCMTGTKRPGIPFKLQLVPAEMGELHNTNQHWQMR